MTTPAGPAQPDDPPAKPPEPYFRALGFVFVRKADVLAATAFLLALVSTIYQFGGFILGPDVRLFAPERILIWFDHYGDGAVVTRFAGQVTFTNRGQQSRGATVRDLRIDAEGAGVRLHERWMSFVRITRNDTRLEISPDADAAPLQVPGGTTESRVVAFAPRIEHCVLAGTCRGSSTFIDDIAFLRRISASSGANLVFRFSGSTFEKGALAPARCFVVVTPQLMTTLAANDWYTAPCFPLEPGQSPADYRDG